LNASKPALNIGLNHKFHLTDEMKAESNQNRWIQKAFIQFHDFNAPFYLYRLMLSDVPGLSRSSG
jgi:hypothetical protein